MVRSDVYPLPHIVLHSLCGKAWFSKSNLMSGYWQCATNEETKPVIAFSSLGGHYKFDVLGLLNLMFSDI